MICQGGFYEIYPFCSDFYLRQHDRKTHDPKNYEEGELKMKYADYLKFYGLADTEESHEDWLHNEWHHGRAYMYEGQFYSTTTGEKLY
jgi:hypothetical protein